MISGFPPGMYSLPPMARNSFLLASTSFETMCQWPIVSPASLNGAGCAAALAAVRLDANNNATNTFVFMDASLLELKTRQTPNLQLQPPMRPATGLSFGLH